MNIHAGRQADALPSALLVDRDPDTRRMYREYLTIGAWAVDEASDGREALAKAIATHPNVVVTETRLPGMSGYDLCAILRRDSATREIPILVVTGDAFESDVARAQRAGADAVLIKPCLPETLLREMSRLVAQSRELRAGHAVTRQTVFEQVSSPERLIDTSSELRRRILSHAHNRHDTTSPPIPPPGLVCPQCDYALVYRRSHIGGVSARHPEQWDYYECPNNCGTFQYRERTRKLRKVG
jgi:CheY-like chemotaxis protein